MDKINRRFNRLQSKLNKKVNDSNKQYGKKLQSRKDLQDCRK